MISYRYNKAILLKSVGRKKSGLIKEQGVAKPSRTHNDLALPRVDSHTEKHLWLVGKLKWKP